MKKPVVVTLGKEFTLPTTNDMHAPLMKATVTGVDVYSHKGSLPLQG